jgi:tRNA nucleotidyltransferase (CCA-adding enzyme)
MARLLPALPAEPPCHLVGGAVRDLLLGLEPVDLDLCVDGDARALARELARRLGGTAREHGAFGTATVSAPGVVFDLARTRRERYERPGALPVVEPAPLSDDLARRDFTVNAMAAPLSGPEAGELVDLHGGVDDLGARTVRVLHAASFQEDPTRLLRAVRYEARLGFRMDPGTEELARAAAASGALATVSGPRVRDELLDLLAEPEVQEAVRRLRKLGLARALHPALDPDARVVAAAAREAPALGAEPGLAALGALAVGLGEDAERWLGGLGLTAGVRARAARAATRGPALALALAEPLGGADLHALLRREPPEALAVARALGAPEEPVRRFLDHLRDVRLEVTGRELIAAGVPPSPRLGRALEETLRLKLDGEVSGRDDELRAALQVARAVDGDPR